MSLLSSDSEPEPEMPRKKLKQWSFDIKKRIVSLWDEGEDWKAAADAIQISRSTCKGWFKQVSNASGDDELNLEVLKPKKKGGSPGK